VDSLEIEPGIDPNVVLGFAVVAGPVNTLFTITSALVAVGASDPWAHVSAALTVTDLDGNGATLTGGHAAGRALEARYNSPGLPVWAGLLGTHGAGALDTEVATDRCKVP
jgi:hypothetical protein